MRTATAQARSQDTVTRRDAHCPGEIPFDPPGGRVSANDALVRVASWRADLQVRGFFLIHRAQAANLKNGGRRYRLLS